jgi:hypothetical protein
MTDDVIQCAALELQPFLIQGKKKTFDAKLHILDVREVWCFYFV